MVPDGFKKQWRALLLMVSAPRLLVALTEWNSWDGHGDCYVLATCYERYRRRTPHAWSHGKVAPVVTLFHGGSTGFLMW